MPKVKVNVPHLSGFDKSHQVLLTGKVGTLIPVLCDEVPANTPIDLESMFSASLPPLASDTYMRVDLKAEAFFVPNRLLYGGYMDWLTGQPAYDPSAGTYKAVGIPRLQVNSSSIDSMPLFDYMGCRFKFPSSGEESFYCNLLPFLAYHRVYDDWYRAPLIQKKVFNSPMFDGGFSAVGRPSTIPFISTASGTNKTFTAVEAFDDGVMIGALRQRNFGFDYFTTALPSPQLGSAKGVSFTVSQGAGTISIAAIRAANSLQQFSERNALAGYKYADYLEANYGANLSSGVAQQSILLGSGSVPVYSKGVYQQSPFESASAPTTNPFANSPGAQFGSAVCQGSVSFAKNFVAQEPGYVLVLVSLVPRVTYSNGIDRMFFRYNTDESQTDMATPLLQNVGNQPIYTAELTGGIADFNSKAVFGWTDRYADFKYKNDRLCALLRDGNSLDVFALQRSVEGSPTINSEFLKIPTDYMDQVAAVTDAISQYGFWLDCYHRYRVSMPLAPFAIPSLQDPAYEHGKSVTVEVGGKRL